MPFCYSPWTNVDINPQGDITPCCKFQMAKYDQKFNIQTHTLDEYIGSAFLAEIKQDFGQGTWPAGCERCKIEEDHSVKSKRNLDYERWQKYYDQIDLDKSSILTASVAFGNTCNLKCITCSPRASSRWQKEYDAIYNIDIAHVKFYKQRFVQDFAKQAPELLHLDIPGGEPFLSGVHEQQDMLQHYIDTGQSSRMTLHYTTNATIWPDHRWWQLWQQFAEVDMQLSIDGIGNRYEYIRYPASWQTLENNVKKYLNKQSSNFRLSVSHTVSAYNIYYLDEFFTWCYTVGLPTPWLGRVHNPAHMRPSVWESDARASIIDNLKTSSHPEVITWAELLKNTNDDTNFNYFKQCLHSHDQYRGLNFKQDFPELAKYI